MTRRIRIGTRGSALALAQTGQMADRLAAALPGVRVEIVTVKTRGDHDRVTPLARFSAPGVFTAALQEALLAGEADLAVHSFKDLPLATPPGLALAAVPEREDPRDALVTRDGRDLAGLPVGARVGTSSPRRRTFLAALRPDLDLVELRGNVDTRLGQVFDGRLDATVLAMAGLTRLGRLDDRVCPLLPELMLPAPAQGALAIEARADDPEARSAAALLDHPGTRAEAAAERACLGGLGGGCGLPLGALAWCSGERLSLRAHIIADGRDSGLLSLEGPATDPPELGERMARLLQDA
jgi:hydroxymethylbilane synthase